MNEITTTMAVASLSFLLTVIWGQPFLYLLRRLKIGKLIRAEGPAVQFEKMGTPTMGGFLFIFPTILINLLLNAANMFGVVLIGQSYVIPMMALVLFAIIGAIDDWEGIRGARRGIGMSAGMKMLLQIILAVFF